MFLTLGDGPSCILGNHMWWKANIILGQLINFEIVKGIWIKWEFSKLIPSRIYGNPLLLQIHLEITLCARYSMKLGWLFSHNFLQGLIHMSTCLQIATLVYKGIPNTPYFESCNKFQGFFPR